MRVLIQRVLNAQVLIQNSVVDCIGCGLVIFLGIASKDNLADAAFITQKALNLRLFHTSSGNFEESVSQKGFEILVVSQFTLFADTRKGRRPSFSGAAASPEAKMLFDDVISIFKESGLRIAQGIFGEDMIIKLENDGPVTIWIDSTEGKNAWRE